MKLYDILIKKMNTSKTTKLISAIELILAIIGFVLLLVASIRTFVMKDALVEEIIKKDPSITYAFASYQTILIASITLSFSIYLLIASIIHILTFKKLDIDNKKSRITFGILNIIFFGIISGILILIKHQKKNN